MDLAAGEGSFLVCEQQRTTATQCIEFLNKFVETGLRIGTLVTVTCEHIQRLKLHIYVAVLHFATRLGHILLQIGVGRNNHLVVVAHILIGASAGGVGIGSVLFLHRCNAVQIDFLTAVEEPLLIGLGTGCVTEFAARIGAQAISLFKRGIGLNDHRKVSDSTFIIAHCSAQQCAVITCKGVVRVHTQHHIKILYSTVIVTKFHQQKTAVIVCCETCRIGVYSHIEIGKCAT